MTTPFDNAQQSLTLTQVVPLDGFFPRLGDSSDYDTVTSFIPLGSIRTFASFFAPGGSTADGDLLPIRPYSRLFSLIGTQYGGDGQTTFRLPDLQGIVEIGQGANFLGSSVVGEEQGERLTTIETGQLPPTKGGSLLPITDEQPSLAITYAIRGHGDGSTGFTGEILQYAGNFIPAGFVPADGSVINVADAPDLAALLGTQYGGNGVTTFGVPDLRNRDLVGASSSAPLGTSFGQTDFTLLNANLPTAIGGGGQAFDNRSPGFAVNYLIALEGIFPRQDDLADSEFVYLSEVRPFLGGAVPDGFAVADGRLLLIGQNQGLFALLGTQFGGDGITTFALPDLRDRVVVGSGTDQGGVFHPVGDVFGTNTQTLTVANIPDGLPPTITLTTTPAGTLEATTRAGAAAIFAASAADVIDGTDPVFFTENVGGSVRAVTSGAFFGLGGHTITATSTDLHGNTAQTSFTFTVADTTPPAAQADAYGAISGSRLTVLASAGVLANDTDIFPETAILQTGPAHGSLTLDPSGAFTYRPTAGYVGQDSFTYKASDGANLSALTTVEFDVAARSAGVVTSGDEGPNSLVGGPGPDELYSLGGDDTMSGGPDVDQLFGGSGSDTVDYSGESAAVYGDLRGQVGFVGGILADTFSSVENLIGGSGPDLLVGDDSSNRLTGGAGADVLDGQGGDDLLVGGSAPTGQHNQLFGGAGSDTAAYEGSAGVLYASVESMGAHLDTGGGYIPLDAYSSVENLVGRAGRDILVGDGGANRLTGGGGADQLYGRGGPDTFIFLSATDSNLQSGYDTIADFETGLDKLDLSAFGIGAGEVRIASDAVSTSLYADTDPGVAGYELAINLIGPNAIHIADVLF